MLSSHVFLVCSVFSLSVRGQVDVNRDQNQYWSYWSRGGGQQNHNAAAFQAAPQAQTSGGGQEAPQTWRDLVSRGNGVHSVEDFISLLVTPSGRQVTEDDIFSPYETQDGKRVITGGGLMAVSDECSPRNMSVRLPLDFSDNQVAYYPECTMVQRCGGCCPTQFLSCEPLYKEKIVLKVLRARYAYPGAFSMRWEGFSSVEVERHLSCQAVCRLQARDCGINKRFIPYQCKCQCLRFQRCTNDQQWDDESCSCRCRNPHSCCQEGEEDERQCIMFYDHNFCECTLKTEIGASPNATQAEIEAWLASRRYIDGRDNHRPVPTTTTTTTTTTTAPLSAASRCARIPCPRNFARRYSNGRCVCQLHIPTRRNYRTRG